MFDVRVSFSFISKFLLVQQKFFIRNRYCVLQLMQWSPCLHPHGKRQCYLWVLYKAKFDDRQQKAGFPGFFLNVATRSNSHPDCNCRKVPVQFSQGGDPLLVLSLLTVKKEDIYKCSMYNLQILFIKLLKDFVFIGVLHQFVPLYQKQHGEHRLECMIGLL